MKYRFEEAVEPEHLDRIRRLDHQTFTQEIPQHASNDRGGPGGPSREGESTFIVALRGALGTMSLNLAEVPFATAAPRSGRRW
jgi:hypothetical protein